MMLDGRVFSTDTGYNDIMTRYAAGIESDANVDYTTHKRGVITAT
jgi:hypothetical protein